MGLIYAFLLRSWIDMYYYREKIGREEVHQDECCEYWLVIVLFLFMELEKEAEGKGRKGKGGEGKGDNNKLIPIILILACGKEYTR